MKFSELEKLMFSQGVTTLAEIARALKTTPQAVSNWKSRDQVPYHIVANINNHLLGPENQKSSIKSVGTSKFYNDEEPIAVSTILLTIAEQLKVILLTAFICVFITFTYVKYIQQPEYISYATILLPDGQSDNLGGLAGLASQFGVNVPMEASMDLSSPSLYPELMKSRTFSKEILGKEFYTKKHGKKLSLLKILTYPNSSSSYGHDTLVTEAVDILNTKYLSYIKELQTPVSTVQVTAFEPLFAKELADVVLAELEALSRRFKSQKVDEKTNFIENRISSVEKELIASEKKLKDFNERNRQISSPSLRLEEERLERDVEVQKGVYLTLKQQLELSKIEQIQKTSIFQILDYPQIAISPSNQNLIINVLMAGIVGLSLGIVIGFVRSYFYTDDINERKKLRRVKYFFNKKTKEIFVDKRISGIICIFLLAGLPLYLGYESNNPVFFNRYSTPIFIINILYILTLIISFYLFFFRSNKS